MLSASREASHFAAALVAKGILLLIAGAVALLWATEALPTAMMTSAALLALTGIYEIALAVRSRRLTRGWPLGLFDGLATIGLAVLTISVTALPVRGTMLLTGLWLALYGALCAALALALWPMPRTRDVLLVWTAIDLGLSAGAVAYYDATIFTLLYVGAAHAIAFGAFQLAAGVWIRRVAVPVLAPTTQSGWAKGGAR